MSKKRKSQTKVRKAAPLTVFEKRLERLARAAGNIRGSGLDVPSLGVLGLTDGPPAIDICDTVAGSALPRIIAGHEVAASHLDEIWLGAPSAHMVNELTEVGVRRSASESDPPLPTDHEWPGHVLFVPAPTDLPKDEPPVPPWKMKTHGRKRDKNRIHGKRPGQVR